jgi:acyl-CoA synthetase (AMP-forming)/AMP-acid ligase II
MDMNVGQEVARSARRFAKRVAVIDVELKKQMTYAELNIRVNKLANALLDMGVRKGDRVALLQWNRYHVIESMYALGKIGAIRVPVNVRLSPNEYTFLLNDSGSNTIILGPEFIDGFRKIKDTLKTVKNVICTKDTPQDMIDYEELIAQASEEEPETVNIVKPEDIYVFQYTGGTTGVPKGPMHTHHTWVRMAYDLNSEVMDTRTGDVTLHCAPLTAAASAFVLGVTIAGATHVLLRQFVPEEVFDTIQRYKVTQTMLVPTMVQLLLYHPSIRNYDLTSLKTISYGASPFPPNHLKAAVEYFGNIFCQFYGLSEVMIPVTTLRKSDHILKGSSAEVARLASAGKCTIPIQVEVVDEKGEPVKPGEVGEVRMKGYMVAQGYWHRDKETREKFREDGWFYSGDMATVDDEDYIFIVDRKNYMIITGGFNVYPKDVEDFLSTHPAILQVAVFGVPDEKYGETVKAVISLKEGATVTEQEIKDFCKKEGLAGYKRPTSVDFVSAIPLTGAGKIDKKVLRAPYWAGKDKKVN